MNTSRKLSDICFNLDLTKGEVIRIWGLPDRNEGSGMKSSVYRLDDGREIRLIYTEEKFVHSAKIIFAREAVFDRNEARGIKLPGT